MTIGRIPSVEGGIQPTIFDAKADILTATAADTPARLAVGNNGETLIADSTASTGLKWAKSPNFVGVSLANTTAQTIANATNTYLTWNTENIDTDGFHSTVSNTERITIPTGLGGKYLVSVQMRFHVNATGDRLGNLVVNGTTVYDVAQYVPSSALYVIAARSVIMNLNAGDYIAFRVYQSSGGNLDHYARTAVEIEGFSAQFLGA